jgi:hypothetical protein
VTLPRRNALPRAIVRGSAGCMRPAAQMTGSRVQRAAARQPGAALSTDWPRGITIDPVDVNGNSSD